MKKIIIYSLMVLTLSFISCKQSSKQIAEEQKALAEKAEAEKAERAKQYQLEMDRSLNIWKDIKFGMTREQVLETEVCKKIEVSEDIEIKGADFVSAKELSNVKLRFGEKSKKLYAIDFYSFRNITANHIDDMEKDCHKIVSIMEEGFKENLKWKKTDISVFDFNEGEEFDLLSDSYGQTTVWVRMGETYEGSLYYYLITAFCSDYSN